jgi:long-chain acyl-CoA synthetase
VKEAAVVGRPDTTFGEVVIAYVVAREGNTISRQRLDALCAQQLSPYKRPIDIRVVDDLPKNATGKVDKSALRQLADSPAVPLSS